MVVTGAAGSIDSNNYRRSRPQALVDKYQSFTQADLQALRAAGCDLQFADVDSGISRYVIWLSTP